MYEDGDTEEQYADKIVKLVPDCFEESSIGLLDAGCTMISCFLKLRSICYS